MPKTIHGKPVDEEKWNKAEELAKKEGKSEDYAYITGIYKKMVGMKSYSFVTDMIDYTVVETKGEKDYFITGYISTKDIDLYNDLISEKGLQSMLKQLEQKNIKLDYEHEAWRDNETILPVGKIVDSRLDDHGLWVKAQLNDASPKFSDLWKSIKKGFVDAFSIAFVPTETKDIMKEGVKIRLIDDLNLLNVALTSVPVNPNCRMDKVFTKALTELNEEEINMPEKKKEEKKEEPEKKEEEKKKEEEEKKPEEKAMPEEKAEEKPAIDMKALEESISKSVTENVLKAIESKFVFKSIQEEQPKENKAVLKSVLDSI